MGSATGPQTRRQRVQQPAGQPIGGTRPAPVGTPTISDPRNTPFGPPPAVPNPAADQVAANAAPLGYVNAPPVVAQGVPSVALPANPFTPPTPAVAPVMSERERMMREVARMNGVPWNAQMAAVAAQR